MKTLLSALLLLAAVTSAQAEDVQHSLYNFQLKMAERGHAEAAFNVAQMNEEGRGTPRDISKALEWYKLAAAKGQPEAAQKVKELAPHTGTR